MTVEAVDLRIKSFVGGRSGERKRKRNKKKDKKFCRFRETRKFGVLCVLGLAGRVWVAGFDGSA